MLATVTGSTLPPGDPRHGTTNGYGNHCCRCDACREANRVYHAEYMKRVRTKEKILGKHGTSLCYDCGCRCDVCREAHNTRSRDYKSARRAAQLKAAE